jgi:hypothetical protein
VIEQKERLAGRVSSREASEEIALSPGAAAIEPGREAVLLQNVLKKVGRLARVGRRVYGGNPNVSLEDLQSFLAQEIPVDGRRDGRRHVRPVLPHPRGAVKEESAALAPPPGRSGPAGDRSG